MSEDTKKTVVLKNGADFSQLELRQIVICLNPGDDSLDLIDLLDVNFNKSCFIRVLADNVAFKHCSFRGAVFEEGFSASEAMFYDDCDFTDTVIHCRPKFDFGRGGTLCADGVLNIGENDFGLISQKNIEQTASFKQKDLSGTVLNVYNKKNGELDYENIKIDFSDCKLWNVNFKFPLKYCNFENADLRMTKLFKATAKQVCSTKNYKEGAVVNIAFCGCDLSNADFSNINLTGCFFAHLDGLEKTLLKDANFTNAVISQCYFRGSEGLTLSQIKSTWNYKSKRMSGVVLPDKLQKELDAEEGKIK
ncbi:MAG: pentapeptide repeat-containing protein [Planctomycetaceae bacterium]|nr:pentapeptide repeat-containing protein [Planctomycetaceae bacterium]